MAIINGLGLEVKVLVNGSAATEYTPDEDMDLDVDNFAPSTKTCCRYVESIDNAQFAIRAGVKSVTGRAGKKWLQTSETNSFTVAMAFDGGRTAVSHLLYHRFPEVICEGVPNRANDTRRKFRFASVSTVDNANKERIAKDLKTAKNMGLIRVVFHRTIMTGKRSSWKPTSHEGAGFAQGGISLAERAPKGKASPMEQQYRSNPVDVKYVDRTDSPFAVFYFLYRSKEALQQELIIPRPRSLSMESSVDNLSPEELRRLARERLSQMKGENKRAASIKDDIDEAPRSSRPHKFVKIEGGKMAIDLTEDD